MQGGGGFLCVFIYLIASVVWEALLSLFFCGDLTKQQYHVIPHMFPELEIPALLQADLLIKQM